jgi:tRNA-dihydrouridine synthase
VRKFVIHARKCLLKGLNPKQNRDIPPLRYSVVHDLVRDFPDLTFVLNGGILTLDAASAEMDAAGLTAPVHGVMMGRAVHNNPLLLATADSRFFGAKDTCVSRRRVLESYMSYCDWTQSELGPAREVKGVVLKATSANLLKPVHNILVGMRHNSRYKVLLNDEYVSRVQRGDTNPPPRAIVSPVACPLRLYAQ